MNRWHVHFSGRVQGVGFRYTCNQVARQFRLTGWVQNLSDGRVELMVEGNGGDLAAAVEEICNNTYGQIDDISKAEAKATGEFDSFQIVG